MKSLNKKISAIVLAGMVVMGGVVSSGVSSFAASANNKVSVQGDQRVKFYCKDYGDIIDVKDKENKLEKIYDNRNCYNNGRSVKAKSLSQIPSHLYKAKYSGKQFVKIEYNSLYYLILLK